MPTYLRAESKDLVCPLPQKTKNMASLILACDYSGSFITPTPNDFERGIRRKVPQLKGVPSDLKFFQYLAKNLSLDTVNLCEGLQSKEQLKNRIRDVITDQIQYVFLGMAGHGVYVPIFKEGKLDHFEWSFLLEFPQVDEKCVLYGPAISQEISEHGKDKILEQVKNNPEKLEESKWFYEHCMDIVLTKGEIDELTEGRSVFALADSCYSSGLCQNSNSQDDIMAFSAPVDQRSYEIHQVTKSEGDRYLEQADVRYNEKIDQQVKVLTDFVNNYFAKIGGQHTEQEGLDLLNKIKEEFNGSDNVNSESLEKIFSEIYTEDQIIMKNEIRNAFRIISNVDETYHEIIMKEAEKNEHYMGELTSFLYGRNFQDLDKNADTKISIEEFLQGSESAGLPPAYFGNNCSGAWRNFPLLDLKNLTPAPVELRSFEHGEEKIVIEE